MALLHKITEFGKSESACMFRVGSSFVGKIGLTACELLICSSFTGQLL